MTKCDFLVLVRKTAKIWGIIFFGVTWWGCCVTGVLVVYLGEL